MKNFRTEGAPRRSGFGGGERSRRGGFGDRDKGRGGFGGRDSSAPRTMHKATCAECGNVCEVPFKPTGEKPVFCSNCFADRSGGPRERNDRPLKFSMDRQSRTDRYPQPVKVDSGRLEEKLELISTKLDKLFTLLTEKSFKGAREMNEAKKVSIIPKKTVVKKKTTSKKVAKKK